jgi:hypothetical protein
VLDCLLAPREFGEDLCQDGFSFAQDLVVGESHDLDASTREGAGAFLVISERLGLEVLPPVEFDR